MFELTELNSGSHQHRWRALAAPAPAAFLIANALLLTLLAAPISAESPTPVEPAKSVEPAPPAVEVQPEAKQPDAEPPDAGQTDAASPDTEQTDADQTDTDQTSEQRESGLPLTELRSFAEVFARIKHDYVEQVDDKALLAAAIRGMLSGLDPHSTYLDAQEYEDLQVGTKGEFGGLGIEVGMENGFVKVIAPIDDTPAARAGVQTGDLIVRIDDQPVKGMSLGDAVKLMRGEPGTGIELTIMRDGEDKPLKIAIERDIIQVASVKARWLEPGYLYVRIANFQSRTTEDMRFKIEELRLQSQQDEEAVATKDEAPEDQATEDRASEEQAAEDSAASNLTASEAAASAPPATPMPIKGLILDLRDNPGGVLNSAVGVSDAFLRGGLIVYTQGRVNDAHMEFKAGPDDIIDGAPMVVLINGGSASASEIVAGALQDQGRAIVMGRDSFGKGSVQTIVPVDGSTALKLTTARYYTPAGRSIQAHGIVPDIRLERASLTLADKPTVAPLKEANLVRHLEEEAPDESTPADQKAQQPLAARDYQLGEALNVLKALSLAGVRATEPSELHQRPTPDAATSTTAIH
ncbi:S41 family peptidase [Rhabdochromatium marinum]|uniref:S41 family peptidase n=1 Tax=Rhabdochromatium marinum TaxID=48729 RepID=UPI001908747E|nr:S41 family peptidase [Rhabdochromatium marinum]MBK1647492.1 peptidase [Rhabdochromatium marinum]